MSFSLLLVALLVAWQLTSPEPSHRKRPRPKVDGVALVDVESRGSRPSRASRPASRPARRPRARVAGPTRIVGRVVHHGTRAPAANAQVKVTFSFETGGEVLAAVATDKDGKFLVPIALGTEPVSASLEITSDKGFGRTDADVASVTAGVNDVGDVELSSRQIVWFHVTTPEGVPIGGAAAVAVPGGGALVRTDGDGNGAIESNHRTEKIRFTAPGFEFAQVAVPPGEDSLNVKLSPAATLTIRVLTAAGPANPDTTMIALESAEFPCPFGFGDPLWQAVGNTTPTGRSGQISRLKAGAPGGEKSQLLTFRASSVRLGPVKAGTRFAISVYDEIRNVKATDAVDAMGADPRVVDILLPGKYGRLSGRVVGPTGVPHAGATVSCDRKGVLRTTVGEVPWEFRGPAALRDLTRVTDQAGEFDFGSLPEGNWDLKVASPSYAVWRALDHEVEAGIEPLTVRLDDGVTIRARVVDANGAPVNEASVYALDRFGSTDADGRVTLIHLPASQLVNFDVFIDGSKTTIPHHTGTPEATFRLEEPGRRR